MYLAAAPAAGIQQLSRPVEIQSMRFPLLGPINSCPNTRSRCQDDTMTNLFCNPDAESFTLPRPRNTTHAIEMQRQLPQFAPTALKSLPELAMEYGVRGIFVKEEGTRAGLGAYKILGASWATFRAICDANDLPYDSKWDVVARAARERGYGLFAATAGNHGRALARLAGLMGITAHIFADKSVSAKMVAKIENEGATVSITDGGYAEALKSATRACRDASNGLHIQDFAFDDYMTIPTYHVEGYGTIFEEIEAQLQEINLQATHVVVPCGGGALCTAATEFAKSRDRTVSVLAVEPEASPCLQRSLQAGKNAMTPEGETIMGGMVSPTVSPVSWQTLKNGVDVSVLITDEDCIAAKRWVNEHEVIAGPCGGGTFAGLLQVMRHHKEAFKLTEKSVIVVVSTDG